MAKLRTRSKVSGDYCVYPCGGKFQSLPRKHSVAVWNYNFKSHYVIPRPQKKIIILTSNDRPSLCPTLSLLSIDIVI